MKSAFLHVCAVLTGVYALSASAATRYVSIAGCDETGAGTAGNPWRTITHAITNDVTAAGDEILVAGGLYRESVTNDVSKGGKERLVFKGGYDGDWTRDLKGSPTIVKPPVNSVPCWYIPNSVSNRVSGFVFTGGSYGIVPCGRTTKSSFARQDVFYTFLSQLVVTNNVNDGILIADIPPGNYQYADDCVISSSYVARNGRYGIYVHIDQRSFYWIVNCTVVDNGSNGFYSQYGTCRLLALNCIFYGNKGGTKDFCAAHNNPVSAVGRSFVGVLDSSLGYSASSGLPGNGNRPLGGVFHDDPLVGPDGSLRADSKCVKAGLDVMAYPYLGASGLSDEDLYGTPWNGEYDIGSVKSAGENLRGFAASDEVYVAAGGDDAAAGTPDAPVASVEEGLYRTAAGGTCRLGPGEWTSRASLFLDGQKLVGAGRGETYLKAFTKGEPAVLIDASGVALKDLTVKDSAVGVMHQTLYAARTNAALEAVNFVNCSNGIVQTELRNGWKGLGVSRSYLRAFTAWRCAFLGCGSGIYANNDGGSGYTDTLTYGCGNCLFVGNAVGIEDKCSMPYQSRKSNAVFHSTFVSNGVYAARYSYAHYPGTIDHRNCLYKGVRGLYSNTRDNINLISCLFDCETDTVWAQTNEMYRRVDNTNTCLYAEARIEMSGDPPGRLLPDSPASRSGSPLADFLGADLTEDFDGSPRDPSGIDIGAFVSPETKQILNPVKTWLVDVAGVPTGYGKPDPQYGMQVVDAGPNVFSVTNGLVRYEDGTDAFPSGDRQRDVPLGYVYTPQDGVPAAGSETSFTVDVQSDAACVWNWERQCLVTVDAGDGGSTVSVNGGPYVAAVTNWGVIGRSLTVSFRENTAAESFVGWRDGEGGSPSSSTQFVYTAAGPASFTAQRRRNRFVSTVGSDETGDGTLSNPWRTITHAIKSAVTCEGDEIRVAAGLYVESVTNDVSKGGKHRLVFKGGYGDGWTRDLRNAPTIVKPPVNTAPCWYIANSASNRVSGFVFTGGRNGIVARGRATEAASGGERAIRTVLSQLVVTNNTRCGILICRDDDVHYVTAGDECLISSCLVANNGTYGIKPHLDVLKFMRVVNCTVFGNGSYGLYSGYSNNRVVMENSVFHGNGRWDVDAGTTYGFSMARRCFIGSFNTAIDNNASVGLPAVMDGLKVLYNVNQPLEGVFRTDPGLEEDGSLAADSRCVKAGFDMRRHPWISGDPALDEDLYGTAWNGEYDIGAIKSAGTNLRGFGASAHVYVAPGGDDAAAGTPESPVATVEEGLYRTAPGGTCHLGPGEWKTHASLFLPGQKLVGAGRTRTVLRPFVPSEAVLIVGESNTRVSGITFRDAPLGLHIVPYLSAATNVTVDACAFRDCTNGIYRIDGLRNTENETVVPGLSRSYKTGLDLSGCLFTGCMRAYWFQTDYTVLDRVSNCVFAYNDYGIYDGVRADYNKGLGRPVVHSTFVSNRVWAAYYSFQHYPGCVKHFNNVYKGGRGLYVYAFDPITLYHCLFDCTENTRWGQTNHDYRRYDSTNTSFSAFADVTLDGAVPGRPRAGSALIRAGGSLTPFSMEDFAVDFDGRERDTRPGRIDIGAFRAPVNGLYIIVK